MDSRSLVKLAVCLAAGVGILARLVATSGDLWFDEIWSIELVRGLGSFAGVFALTHDNNHLLNSLWVRLVDPGAMWVYRALSLAASVAVLAGMAIVAVRDAGGKIWSAPVLTLGLFATSYPAILYGTEARGYSVAIAASLLAYWMLMRGPKPVAYWAVCVAGLLSHLTFLFTLAGACAYGASRPRTEWRRHIVLHSVPLAVAVILYLTFYRHLPAPRGPAGPYARVVSAALSIAYGGQPLSPYEIDLSIAMFLWSLIIGGLVTAELLVERKERRGDWPFLAAAIVATPVAALAIKRPEYLAERYLLIPLIFSYVLMARAFERWRWTAVVGVAVLIGNALLFSELAVAGRGTYQTALRSVAAQDPSASIGSDEDWWGEKIFAYYRSIDASLGGLEYRKGAAARWLIVHADDSRQPAATACDAYGSKYALWGDYRSAPLSGFRWLVYQRIDRTLDGVGPPCFIGFKS